MAAAAQRALRGVQQLIWPARSPDLSRIEHVWDIMKRELLLTPEPATTIAELRQRTVCMAVCMREFIPAVLPEGINTLYIDVAIWVHLTVIFVFHLVRISYLILLQ